METPKVAMATASEASTEETVIDFLGGAVALRVYALALPPM